MRSHDLIAASTWLLATLPLAALALMTALLTPLALRAAVAPRWLCRAAWPAGALAALACGLAPGALAGTCVAPYAAVTGLAGLVGVRRLLGTRGDAAIAASLVLLPGAATWLVADRAGHALLGYPPFWVELTAAHFHVAGCYLAVIAGRAARGRGPLPRAIALGCVVCVPLTAIGIAGPRWLEVGGSLAMAACGLAAGALVLATPRLRPAGAILLASMPLAAWFALRDQAGAPALGGLDPLAAMLVAHGAPNAVLFAGVGLALLARAPRPLLASAPPMSRLRARGRVGADFLARRGLEVARTPQPIGLVDDLAELAHPAFEPARVPAPIRAFYEATASQEMRVEPHWRAGFRTGGRLFAALVRPLDQLQLPIAPEPAGIAMRLVAVDEAADGRRAPRAWIRTFSDGRALYCAVYSTHERAGIRYMNIAFPLPGGHITSVLQVQHLGAGITVSTRLGGDCGMYASLFGTPIRLPLSETVDVWTADDPAAPADLRAWGATYATLARHTLFFCGVRFLTLRYAMRPAGPV